MIIGDRVRERMEEAGFSQAELARRVGVAQPTIYSLIHSNKIGSKHIHRIARELGTTPAYLSGETSDPDEDAPPPPELTSDERQVLDFYRRLGAAQRTAWPTIAASMVGEGPSGSVQAPQPAYGEQPR